MEKLLIDSDVIINFLTQETETASGRPLWTAPAAILELGEQEQLLNHVSLISVFETRFVLRRKRTWPDHEIERDLAFMQNFLQFITPDLPCLEQANRLQAEQPLDPFDSILLAQCIDLSAVLISRDQKLLDIAANYIPAFTPERYIDYLLK